MQAIIPESEALVEDEQRASTLEPGRCNCRRCSIPCRHTKKNGRESAYVEITSADVDWIAHDYTLLDIWCLTFVRGLDETEALRRVGVKEGSIGPLTHGELMNEWPFPPIPNKVLAGRLGGWIVLVEVFGWKAWEALQVLSAETEAVSVRRNDHATDSFAYAIDGKLVTSFDPMSPESRWGSDPNRLVDLMREVGLEPAYEPSLEDDEEDEQNEAVRLNRPTLDGALMLAARLTGVVLTPEVLSGPLLGADVATHRSQD